jgi:hypothetical protein
VLGGGKHVSEHTVATALRRLELHVFKFLGDRPIRGITAPEPLAVLRRVESLGVLRKSEWTEFNLHSDTPEWRIPDKRMKMKEPHIVPLSRQSVEIPRELKHSTAAERNKIRGATTGRNTFLSEER